MILCLSALPLGCKSQKEQIPMLQPLNEATENQSPQEIPSQEKPAAGSTASPQPHDTSSGAPVDLCATNPDLYQEKDGQCVLIPLPSVEGELMITSGLIWKPDLSRCRRAWSNDSFRFCSGGVHASVPLALPVQGTGKVRFSLSFNCKSIPPQNALALSIGNETKVTLTSVMVDTPIFSDEISVEAGLAKSVRLDFTPNYDATYPADCRINLIENRAIESAG
jgi:hypothetical protein